MPGKVHLDEAFTAQWLKDVSQRRFPVVHVASHFRFSPGAGANSFLLLGDGRQPTLGELRAQNHRQHGPSAILTGWPGSAVTHWRKAVAPGCARSLRSRPWISGVPAGSSALPRGAESDPV